MSTPEQMLLVNARVRPRNFVHCTFHRPDSPHQPPKMYELLMCASIFNTPYNRLTFIGQLRRRTGQHRYTSFNLIGLVKCSDRTWHANVLCAGNTLWCAVLRTRSAWKCSACNEMADTVAWPAAAGTANYPPITWLGRLPAQTHNRQGRKTQRERARVSNKHPNISTSFMQSTRPLYSFLGWSFAPRIPFHMQYAFNSMENCCCTRQQKRLV